jgi:hypothetical protein
LGWGLDKIMQWVSSSARGERLFTVGRELTVESAWKDEAEGRRDRKRKRRHGLLIHPDP